MGRRPTLKSDELFGVTIRLQKLQRSAKVDFSQKWFSYWEFDPPLMRWTVLHVTPVSEPLLADEIEVVWDATMLMLTCPSSVR